MSFTVQERIAIVESYVRTQSIKETRAMFAYKFPMSGMPAKSTILDLVANWRSTGSVVNIKEKDQKLPSVKTPAEALADFQKRILTADLEARSLLPSRSIKQEPDYEAEGSTENAFDAAVRIKQEYDVEGHTVKEVSDEEEIYMRLAIKKERTNLTSAYPDEGSFFYCEECQLKYEGDCPEHGPLITVYNTETVTNMESHSLLPSESIKQEPDCQVDHNEGCSQDSITQLLAANKMDRQVTAEEQVEQTGVGGEYQGTHYCVQGYHPISKVKYLQVMPGDKYLGLDKQDTLLENNCSNVNESDNRGGTTSITHMSGAKRFTCDICDAGFASCSNLKVHIRTHTGDKPYKCDICSIGFAVRSSLTVHKRIHTGEKPYKCDVCGVWFTQHNNLKMHKRIHTGEKPYICDVCDTGFAQQEHLNTHRRTHTGEKPYRCDVCGLGFAIHSTLTVHKRTHTGEKPYKCDVCGVGFTKHSALTRHKRIHTGEKPYKCDVCDAGFTKNSTLTKHKRTHT